MAREVESIRYETRERKFFFAYTRKVFFAVLNNVTKLCLRFYELKFHCSKAIRDLYAVIDDESHILRFSLYELKNMFNAGLFTYLKAKFFILRATCRAS